MSLGNHAINQIHALNINKGAYSGLGLSRVPTEANTLNILVGLGGSGCDMLREAKGLINRICKDDLDRKAPPKRVVYLGIDTDNTDNGPLKSDWECSDGVKISLRSTGSNAEVFALDNADMAAMMDPSNYASNKNQYPHIMSWLDLDSKKNLRPGQTGACGVRQAGRLCLFKSMSALVNKIDEVVGSAQSGQTIHNANIFLLSGISGGTGSGTYLDMAYILREQVRRTLKSVKAENIRVLGYLLMPDVNEQNAADDAERSYIGGNGYAALQELEYLMSLPQVGGKFTQTYIPNSFTVDTEKAPFDYVHLMSHKTADGQMPDDYYQRCMAAAAQSILACIARETHDGGVVTHSMDAHYSNITNITNHTIKTFPERSYNYLALGTAEFALPMDDIYKYVTTLLFNGMNQLFQVAPSPADAEEALARLDLTQDNWITRITGSIPDPFPSVGNTKAVFATANQNQTYSTYENSIESAEQTIACLVATYKDKLLSNINELMDRYFVDKTKGPVWVNHLIIYNLLNDLKTAQDHLATKLTEKDELIQAEQRTRNNLSKGMFKSGTDADSYMQSWNRQFALELEVIALKYLYEDLLENGQDEPSVATMARQYLSQLNNSLFDVVTKVLQSIKDIANQNTGAVVHTTLQNKNFTWQVIALPQISQTIQAMFQGMDINQLVQSFLTDLLVASKDWMNNGVDVTNFLEDYLNKNLQSITSQGLDHYLNAIYVSSGIFPTLNAALTGPNGLFQWLLTEAKHLFLTNETHNSAYLLSVPDSCPGIVEAATQFCNANNINLQRSSVRSRICIQNVACAIPLYHYTEAQKYEDTYFSSPTETQSGRHLRAFWSQNGQVKPQPGDENWFRLPSLIPARTRGDSAGACPEAVAEIEKNRRTLFRALCNHRAVRLQENVNNTNEFDCILYVSKPWANCGVLEILGHDDQNLKTRGTYDRDKVKTVLAELEALSNGNLPTAAGARTGVDSHMLDTRVVLEQCWRQAIQDYKDAHSHAANMGDIQEASRLKAEGCLRIAEEYFIASMPLCMKGEVELDKYSRLDKEIQRIKNIQANLGDFVTDCENVLKLFVTESVRDSANRNNQACYAYRNDHEEWDADTAGLVYSQAAIREYQLLLRLSEMRASNNVHVVDLYRSIVGLAQARYNRISARQLSKDEAKTLVKQIETLIDETIRRRIDAHTQNLVQNQSGIQNTYTEEGQKFYVQMKASAESMKANIIEAYELYKKEAAPAPAPVSNPAQPSDTWTCICGAMNKGKFCSECGQLRPEPKKTWVCAVCGAENIGKFCSECGTPRPEPKKAWVCAFCGAENTGKFCSECGRPPVLSQRCPQCGWEPEDKSKTHKFCPECGHRF